MYITQEDLEKIQYYLGELGIKDTQFPELLKNNGDEYIPLISDGKNYKVSLDNFFSLAKDSNKDIFVSTDIEFQGTQYDNIHDLLLALIAFTINNARNIYLNSRAINRNTAQIDLILEALKKLQISVDELEKEDPLNPGNPDNPNKDTSLYYKPSDTIPNTILSEKHGNLLQSSKDELRELTFSQLFDKILFKEEQPDFNYHTEQNTLTARHSVEVGTTYTRNDFKVTTGTAIYQFPKTTVNWAASEIAAQGVAELGNNAEVASCTFTLEIPRDSLALQTNYGNTTQVRVSTQIITLKADIKGHYNLGWMSGDTEIPSTFNLIKVEDYPSDLLIPSKTSSKYVYLALPITLSLSSSKVQNPFDTTDFQEMPNFKKVSLGVSLPTLSSVTKYNIWRIGKATDNYDGTPTPNNKPIKITAIKS